VISRRVSKWYWWWYDDEQRYFIYFMINQSLESQFNLQNLWTKLQQSAISFIKMIPLMPSAKRGNFGINHVRTLFYITSFTQYVRKIYNSHVKRKLTNYA